MQLWDKRRKKENLSNVPFEMVSICIWPDHLHAAGVEQVLSATRHTRLDHVLRSWQHKKMASSKAAGKTSATQQEFIPKHTTV